MIAEKNHNAFSHFLERIAPSNRRFKCLIHDNRRTLLIWQYYFWKLLSRVRVCQIRRLRDSRLGGAQKVMRWQISRLAAIYGAVVTDIDTELCGLSEKAFAGFYKYATRLVL